MSGLEHLDCFDFGDEGAYSVSLVRDPGTGGLLVEIQYGLDWEHRLMLPLAADPAAGSFEELATATGQALGEVYRSPYRV